MYSKSGSGWIDAVCTPNIILTKLAILQFNNSLTSSLHEVGGCVHGNT